MSRATWPWTWSVSAYSDRSRRTPVRIRFSRVPAGGRLVRLGYPAHEFRPLQEDESRLRTTASDRYRRSSSLLCCFHYQKKPSKAT